MTDHRPGHVPGRNHALDDVIELDRDQDLNRDQDPDDDVPHRDVDVGTFVPHIIAALEAEPEVEADQTDAGRIRATMTEENTQAAATSPDTADIDREQSLELDPGRTQGDAALQADVAGPDLLHRRQDPSPSQDQEIENRLE